MTPNRNHQYFLLYMPFIYILKKINPSIYPSPITYIWCTKSNFFSPFFILWSIKPEPMNHTPQKKTHNKIYKSIFFFVFRTGLSSLLFAEAVSVIEGSLSSLFSFVIFYAEGLNSIVSVIFVRRLVRVIRAEICKLCEAFSCDSWFRIFDCVFVVYLWYFLGFLVRVACAFCFLCNGRLRVFDCVLLWVVFLRWFLLFY